MKQGRWIGVIIVILAAIAGAWWVMAPTPPPKKPVVTTPAPKPKKPKLEVATDMPEVTPDEPRVAEAPDKEEPAGFAPDDAPEVKPGEYNPAMLPPPATSYQDDPKRFGRNYQSHATLASDAWSKLAESVTDPALKAEIEEVSRDLKDPSADPLETTHAEILLDNRIRNQAELDPKAQNILDYLNQMSSSVIQDGDPKAIPPPK